MSWYRASSLFVGRGTKVATRRLGILALVVTVLMAGPGIAAAKEAIAACPNGILGTGNMKNPTDIDIDTTCTVQGGVTPYYYKNVNIVAGGKLIFADPTVNTNFWAASIIIENGGAMLAGVVNAGTPSEQIIPIGTAVPGVTVTIHIYGPQQTSLLHAVGVKCATPSTSTSHQCGIPDNLFMSNMMATPPPNMPITPPTTCNPASKYGVTLPNNDCFYMYDSMPYDDGGNVKTYFGYKVIGLSYGGTLRLYGRRGAVYPTDPDQTSPNQSCDGSPACTGKSWVRLNSCAGGSSGAITGGTCVSGVLQPGATQLILSSPATNWKGGPVGMGDQIVLTSTDFLPAHSEQLEVGGVSIDGLTITLNTPTKFPHHASTIDLTSRIPQNQGLTDLAAVDTRAAVALLTRSIQIVSGGDNAGDAFPGASTGNYFGAHVVFRQGFAQLQLQGVEFYQLGEGGRIGHYPVHFHMARQVPPNTFVKDSSVWDSMTRWFVLHATQNVLLARNVGYLSIGHGYYLEDGTETNNKLYANLGVTARAAVGIRALVDNKDSIKPDAANPRMVPGILASLQDKDGKPYPPDSENTPYDSDYQHPTLFWFMNGWNDFQSNMAVGAETCGMCYWMPPGGNSGGSQGMFWTGYASEQANYIANQGTTPFQNFTNNTCSTAMTAFTDIGNTTYCTGLNSSQPIANLQYKSIPNPVLKNQVPKADRSQETFFPRVNDGGNHHTTLCPGGDSADCSKVNVCSDAVPNPAGFYASQNCSPLVLNRFTTSFNFAAHNFSAIWFRPQWSLLLNSAMTDDLNGGIGFVSGGGYTRSDALRGLWHLARKSVFIGSTQPYESNPYGSNGGPVNPGLPTPRPTPDPLAPLKCGNPDTAINYCIPVDSAGNDLGINLLRENFAMNQRFFNIYDGPSLQDSNSYLDITPTQLNDCSSSNIYNKCDNSAWMQKRVQGVPGVFNPAPNAQQPLSCYLPNAAIAWKQSNGFYYPPAFHSRNLYFNNVDIRHYVIEPQFMPGTFITKDSAVRPRYCVADPGVFNNFTDIDRQTELNDDDGTLTGLVGTISVNEDQFFSAPTEDIECRSDIAANTAGTAKTSPYDYVTAVVYPDCGTFPRTIVNPADPMGPQIPNPLGCAANGSVWNYNGANNQTYGPLLYRQLLNPGETAAPFIKMMSQDTGQRSTLVPNNGIYYLDTTVDTATQRMAGAVNLSVFEPGKTYHVFTLFAKPSSLETFQVFIGKGLSNDYISKNVLAEVGNAAAGQMSFTAMMSWPSGWHPPGAPAGQPDYDATSGILTVTLDLSPAGGSGFADAYDASIPGRCQPTSFCSWNGSACVCNETALSMPNNPLNYLLADCKADNSNICSYATKDIDYPDDPTDPGKTRGAAYGFRFTLPPACLEGSDQNCFSTQPTQPARDALRPAASCFPADPLTWDVSFATTMEAGDCNYANLPPSPMFCNNPAPTPTPVPMSLNDSATRPQRVALAAGGKK
jgi:hypothetical protein